jgi:hypothetical protein
MLMSYGLRNYRHRNPKTGDEQKASTPFFQSPKGASIQKKKEAFFQPKLTIGKPGDVYEKEADSVASQVVNRQKGQQPVLQQKEIGKVQRLATSKEEEKLGTNDARMERDKEDPLKPVQKKEGEGDLNEKDKKGVPAAAEAEQKMKGNKKGGDAEKKKKKGVQKAEDPKKKKKKEVQKAEDPEKKKKKEVQKAEDPEKKKKKEVQKAEDPEKKKKKDVQKAEDPEKKKKKGTGAIQKKEETTASAHVAAEIEQQSGKGSPLPAEVLAEMNSSFGVDFSKVRIHHDTAAARLCCELNAQAFTHGLDIFFNEGKYNPESTEGKLLLAHELTHVAQQSN